MSAADTRVLVYDMEILRPIPERNGKPDWNYAKAGKCGIASAVVYDSDTGRYHLYDQHNVDALVEHLNQGDVCVGFNNSGFDKPAIEGSTGLRITSRQLDLLEECRRNFRIAGHGLWGLGAICERTLGIGKSGDGASAPHLAATHRWASLFDYNLNDTFLTLELYNHIQEEGWVMGPDGQKKYLATSQWPKGQI